MHLLGLSAGDYLIRLTLERTRVDFQGPLPAPVKHKTPFCHDHRSGTLRDTWLFQNITFFLFLNSKYRFNLFDFKLLFRESRLRRKLSPFLTVFSEIEPNLFQVKFLRTHFKSTRLPLSQFFDDPFDINDKVIFFIRNYKAYQLYQINYIVKWSYHFNWFTWKFIFNLN